MHTILLIGAGNIGRRHLQGLLLSDLPYQIYVVDPIAACIQLAKEAVQQVNDTAKKHHQLYYLSAIQQLPTIADVAIVATNADVRKDVIVQLLEQVTLRFLVLEKVLFQQMEDYKIVGQLLYKKKVAAYVNCTRRYFPHYRKIANLIRQAESSFLFSKGLSALAMAPNQGLPIKMEVTGSNWGLACNVIHLLDLFQFMNEHNVYNFTTEGIDKEIIASKRQGFIELSGTIATEPNAHYSFSASSFLEPGHPIEIKITAGDHFFHINETAGTVHYTAPEREDGTAIPTVAYEMFPLSKSAYLFVNDLLQKGQCELTGYFVSAQLHRCLLQAFGQFLDKKIDLSKGIPIT